MLQFCQGLEFLHAAPGQEAVHLDDDLAVLLRIPSVIHVGFAALADSGATLVLCLGIGRVLYEGVIWAAVVILTVDLLPWGGVPTGPLIVLTLFAMLLVSLLAAPRRSLIARGMARRRARAVLRRELLSEGAAG